MPVKLLLVLPSMMDTHEQIARLVSCPQCYSYTCCHAQLSHFSSSIQNGETALTVAGWSGSPGIVLNVIRAGASIDHQDNVSVCLLNKTYSAYSIRL